MPVTIDIFDNDDGIIDEHAEREDQTKQNNHIERDAHNGYDDKGNEHREGNGDTDKKGIAEAQEKEEHQNDEDKARYDIVFEVFDHHANIFGLVAQNGDLCACGKGGVQIVERYFNLIGYGNQIFTAAFDNFETHTGLVVEAGVICAVLKPIYNIGNIANIDQAALRCFDEEVANLGNGFKLAGYTHGVFVCAHIHATAGKGQIFALNGLNHVLDSEFVGDKAVGIDIDFDFVFETTHHAYFEDAGNGFDMIGEVFGNFFEPNKPIVSRQCDDHHGDIGKVDFENRGVFCIIG